MNRVLRAVETAEVLLDGVKRNPAKFKQGKFVSLAEPHMFYGHERFATSKELRATVHIAPGQKSAAVFFTEASAVLQWGKRDHRIKLRSQKLPAGVSPHDISIPLQGMFGASGYKLRQLNASRDICTILYKGKQVGKFGALFDISYIDVDVHPAHAKAIIKTLLGIK